MPFPRILRLQDDKWNNPEDSIGTFIGYLRGGRYRCWEAAGPARQAFRELSPDIKDFLETSSIPPTDIVSWSIYMVGHNERNAAPKLLICSTDSKTRKNIRQLIKESRIMDKYPGIGLGDVSALPDRPIIRELSREAIEALLPFGCDIDGAVLADGSEPALGKRIFVVNPHDFSLRPVTAGPIILQDSRCYQLTVAHAFRHTREADHSSGQQMSEDDCDFDGMSDDERDDESQYDEITSKGSATPGEIDSDEASFEASLDALSRERHSSSRSESPSSDHLGSRHDSRLSVEPPEDNPRFGEFDVSRLEYFGKLVLSSLKGSNPSLDYALIETSRKPETVEKSVITASMVSNIGEIESHDISIVATTWPYYRVQGQLTATPSYIRLPEHCTFQEVYPVRLGKLLQDGDCGTAVFSKDDNRFYGHIVAGSPGTSFAYVVPAGEISRDVQARLGFGLISTSQQEGQRQHSEDDLQLSRELYTGLTNYGVTSIKNLGASEPQGCWLPESNIEVQQWPQPSQNNFVTSHSLTEHGHQSALGAQKEPSSVQTTGASTPTAFTVVPVNERLQRSRGALPSFYQIPTVPDRKTRYHDNGKHDKKRPADSLPPQDWPTSSSASSGPQTRSRHTGPTTSPGQQFGWSRIDTDTSSALDQLPKHQKSDSTDNSRYLLPIRNRSGHRHSTSRRSLASVSPVQPATSLSPQKHGFPLQTRDIPSPPSHGDSGSSSTQWTEAAGSIARRSVLPEDFEGARETCVFWLLAPEKFSSPEWQACRGRKDEISHIITHITDHHGLIHGRDPLHSARKYLASCQSSNPFVKAKRNCEKCSSLFKWNDRDFADPTHHGVVLCLRCWRKFDKKGMKEHMAGPLCDYNAEQPKTQKLWILYTAFCSGTQLPSKPPKYRAPRKSPHRPSPRTMSQYQQQSGHRHTVALVGNLEATISPSGTRLSLPRLQPGSSLAPSTAEESTEGLNSANLDASMHFWDKVNDLDVDMSRWDFIGSQPDLQTTSASMHPIWPNANPPLTLQLTDRHQKLEPEGRIWPLQMAAIESDSECRSTDEKDM
ncbi:hypothetical protein FPRO03_03833 [Fusarium proliferatum]|nr:hypothetical protein FPRO03_03833 [Fusarium proliferatum]